jgi:hypothetical protein
VVGAISPGVNAASISLEMPAGSPEKNLVGSAAEPSLRTVTSDGADLDAVDAGRLRAGGRRLGQRGESREHRAADGGQGERTPGHGHLLPP